MTRTTSPAPDSRPRYRTGSGVYEIDDCSMQEKAIRDGCVHFRGWSAGWYPGEPIDRDTLGGISGIGTLDTVGWREWGNRPHRNEGIEICYLEAGSTVLRVGRRRFELEGGTLTVTRPWQLHSLGDPTILRCRLHWFILDVGVRAPGQAWSWPAWIVLSQTDLAELSHLFSRMRCPVVPGSPDLKHGFQQIARALSRNEAGRFSRMAVHINMVLLGLLDALRPQPPSRRQDEAERRQERVRRFLHQLAGSPDLLAEPWTLGRMAESCEMHSTAFVKYCRAVTNQSPVDYLIGARLEQAAKLLLEQPDRRITDIAMACGFSSSQYFATQFKRHTSLSPRAWRAFCQE